MVAGAGEISSKLSWAQRPLGLLSAHAQQYAMPVVGFLIGTSTPKGNFANLDERHKVIESVWHGYNASLTLAPAGRKVCWRRAYDAKHLAAHPQQRITELTFFLRVSGYDSGGGYVFKNPHHIFYNFAFSLKRRGNKRGWRRAAIALGRRPQTVSSIATAAVSRSTNCPSGDGL